MVFNLQEKKNPIAAVVPVVSVLRTASHADCIVDDLHRRIRVQERTKELRQGGFETGEPG